MEDDSDGKDSCNGDEDYDSEGPLSGDEVNGQTKEFLFMQEETRSRFTEYSMTSSVIRRNEQLTLLDDRFEKVRQLKSGKDVKCLFVYWFLSSSSVLYSRADFTAFSSQGIKPLLFVCILRLILGTLGGFCHLGYGVNCYWKA